MDNILDRSNSYLRIFTEPFVVDDKLPKWSRLKNGGEPERTVTFGEFSSMNAKEFNVFMNKEKLNEYSEGFGTPNMFFVTDAPAAQDGDAEPKSKMSRFVMKLKGRKAPDVKKTETYAIDVIKFFECVKLTIDESKSAYEERITPYIAALKQAQEMGQTALADKLVSMLATSKYESVLRAEGFDKKISESQIVNFVKQAEKGLQLTYVKNYARPIPSEVYETKKKADELEIFDNYCILYYDPEGKSYKQTAEEENRERAKKADPILFGMIKGSRNLYYVADWVDEYYDLTLSEFMKVSKIKDVDIEISEKIKF